MALQMFELNICKHIGVSRAPVRAKQKLIFIFVLFISVVNYLI